MSILIKGMEMPKPNTMFTVTLRVRQDGTAEFISTSGETAKSFPMIDVPTPHGDLIDRDEFAKDKINLYGTTDVVLMVDIENAPTIIEAEVSGE